MKPEKITLNWKGPFNYDTLKQEIADFEGLYLYCSLKEAENYIVHYVGKCERRNAKGSSTVFQRLNKWKSELINKKGTFLKYDRFNAGDNWEMDFIISYDEKSKTDVTDQICNENKELTRIFIAEVNVELKSVISMFVTGDCKPVYALEGALKNKLRISHKTRQYITHLEPPNYALKFSKIVNVFPPGINVLGL